MSTKSSGIERYLKDTMDKCKNSPSPPVMFIEKAALKRYCEGGKDIRPDILKALNDESIADTVMLEIHNLEEEKTT